MSSTHYKLTKDELFKVSKIEELVKKVRKTGFTIAVEAGSQRLRDVINKNIQEKDIGIYW